MHFVLGVDGGGTKTLARLFRTPTDGTLDALGEGTATGSNPYSVGWPAAQQAIADAAQAACRGFGDQPDAIVLAVAGCASEAARERLAEWATSAQIARRVWVVPDTEPLLAEAPLDQPVIGLIAGTGSAAIARSAAGVTTIGGWGYLIDDAGSGYAIGRDALKRLVQLADAGAAADALSAALLRQAGVTQPAELKALVYGDDDPRAWISRLAPQVIGLAEEGDALAAQILQRNAEALCRLTKNAATRAAPTGSDRPNVLFAGGLLRESSHYRGLVVEALIEAGWAPESLAYAPDAATGCARIAVEKLDSA